MWKRISAFIFDGILLVILAIGIALVLSSVLRYDSYHDTLNGCYEKYAKEYGISLDLTKEQYDKMSEQERSDYDASLKKANEALSKDPDAQHAYSMVLNLTLLITTISLLLAFLGWEFVVPLIFGNGQTMGKKIFGVALMRPDGVKINTVSLFIRTILGKFTIETMIPVLIIMMILGNAIGVVGIVILGAIIVLQVILLATSDNRSLIHDFLANTVAVDLSSQMIFESEQALIDYKQKLHAEKAARQDY